MNTDSENDSVNVGKDLAGIATESPRPAKGWMAMFTPTGGYRSSGLSPEQFAAIRALAAQPSSTPENVRETAEKLALAEYARGLKDALIVLSQAAAAKADK
jgi:hypothetical protein